MLQVWLLYDEADYLPNRDFAAMMAEKGAGRGMNILPVLTNRLSLCLSESGQPYCLLSGEKAQPDAVLSRQRNPIISRHFERMGIPVFNNARVCEICNHKFVTHQFLSGIPMPKTELLQSDQPAPESGYPYVLKPACSHGGDRVTLVKNADEWQAALAAIHPEPAIRQQLVSDAGRDLRVYVVFGQIIAGVMRTAKTGIVSNFKRGGDVCLNELTPQERALAQCVIDRFEAANAPLSFAGIDFLYHHGSPVLGEVEDVVGSRMLYQVSSIDIVSLFLDALLTHLHP